MRKVIKAASNPTRDRAIDLQNFLIGQGVSEHDMLTEILKKLSADDAVDYLEDIARDFDIPLEDEVQASTEIVASKTEDEWRAEYFSPENYPDVDPKRLSDMLSVNWGDSVSADDSEYFVNEFGLFPDFSAIESIDLSDDDVWDLIVDDRNFAGVYTIEYKDGHIQYVAWKEYPHNDEMVDVTDQVAKKKANLNASTEVVGSKRTKSAEDKLRAEWYTEENYADELADTSRCKDLLAIDWNDVTAEDCETFLLDQDAFPVLKNIKSVRYFDDAEQKWAEENGYDGGYVVTFSKPAGDVKYAAWNFGVDKFDDVSDEIAETFSKKINSATNVSDVNTSTVSFDFINDGDYDGNAIIDSVMDILRSYGTNPLGGSFEEVDYSGYPEYANEIVSQCNVDFEWEDDYDADAIEDEIGIALMPLEVIGVQFNAVGE